MAESCTDSVMLKHGITAAGMCAWLHPAAAMGCSTAAMVLARGQLPGRRNPCHKVGYLLGLWETRSTQALLLSEAQCGCWCCVVSLSLRTQAGGLLLCCVLGISARTRLRNLGFSNVMVKLKVHQQQLHFFLDGCAVPRRTESSSLESCHVALQYKQAHS